MQDFFSSLDSIQVPVTVADPSIEDCPLIYVNQRFSELTGYRDDEIVGRNCRFLQTEWTDPQAVDALREAVLRCHGVTTCLLNAKRDGGLFNNLLFMEPLTLPDGRLVFFGSQFPVHQDLADIVIERHANRICDTVEHVHSLTTKRDLEALDALKERANGAVHKVKQYFRTQRTVARQGQLFRQG